MDFIHLHTYSSYTLLSSTITPEKLALTAKDLSFQAIALTDHNVMYGVIPFYKSCKKAGIKPIIGLTADIATSETQSYPLILLAKSYEGFKNLMKISSVIQTKSPNGLPLKWLKHYAKGLFAISGGMEGAIEQQLLNGEEDQAKETCLQFTSMFEENSFYLNLQYHGDRLEKDLIEKLVLLSKEIKVPMAATNKVFYLQKQDHFTWQCLTSIKNGEKVTDENSQSSQQFYLKSKEEMYNQFSAFEEALSNTIAIADQCNVSIPFHQSLLPKYPLQNISADDYLSKICQDGLIIKVPNASQEYKERLAYELSVIKRMKFSDYFLIVWDFIKFAKENGMIIGPGRGSAAGSLVAYVLDITDVDPIKHELLFERFLNPERVSMPDIDIDFPDHRRDEVIEYVAKKYGELHVAQIATFGTLAAKAALRDVGRTFGLTTAELDQLSKAVPSKLGISLREAYDQSETLRKLVDHSSVFSKVFEIAIKIEGLPRHVSTHAAGVVISDRALVDLIPIQSGTNQVYLTQYPMDVLEEIGLLKMDFLGLRNLTFIELIIQSIERKEKRKIPLKQIPMDDEKTFSLLSKGDTTGIFQLESDGMRRVLQQLKPSEFEDIVAVNALYRPGPMNNIPIYIRRKHGVEEISYPHPDLKSILKKTYGVIVYQEQIMQISSMMAGFTLGEADLLRRAVGKKKREVLDEERKHFVTGAINKGYEEKVANEIYDLIVRFADYGFNRSHAVAYSMISYQLAYLKAHYPLHFMAALLTTVIGNEDKTAQYVKELQHMGYQFFAPSINHSKYSYIVADQGLICSLAAIKGVGVTALKEIFRARSEKPFEDLFDFCLRVNTKIVNRKTIEALIYSGSFDEFGQDRATLLATIDVALNHAQLVKPDDQLDLFEDVFNIKPKYVEVEPIPVEEKLKFEKQVLGMFVSQHPLTIYREWLKAKGAVFLEESKNKKNEITAAYITDERKIRTKNGQAMAFVKLSDEHGEIEGVIFPDTYKKYSAFVKIGELVYIQGHLEERMNKKQWVIQHMEHLDDAFEKSPQGKLFIKIGKSDQKNSLLGKMKFLIEKYKGRTPVILFYENENRTVQLAETEWINVKSNCIRELKHLLGEKNVILKL